MKAILVLDKMPEACYKCDRSVEGWNTDEDVFGLMCTERHGRLIDCFYNERPDWCSLRPLPERKRTGHLSPPDSFAPGELDIFLSGFLEGFNRCLDEITGEVEE